MISTFQEYSEQARSFAHYPKDLSVAYLLLGLTGEAGELANKYKKVLRDDSGEMSTDAILAMRAEVGDVLWYLDRLAETLGSSLEDEATHNIAKLTDRHNRGVVSGSGDQR